MFRRQLKYLFLLNLNEIFKITCYKSWVYGKYFIYMIFKNTL